jgi:uncharacterized protein
MKLQSDVRFAARAVSAYGPGYVAVGGERLTRSFLLGPDGLDTAWGPDSFDGLNESHCGARRHPRRHAGTGALPRPALWAAIERRIGVEVMDTPAACRTYNILMAEGRDVAAALIVECAR